MRLLGAPKITSKMSNDAHGLQRKTNHGAESMQAGALRSHLGKVAVDPTVGEIDRQHDEDDDERRLDHAMQCGALMRADHSDPTGVGVG